MSRGPTAQRLAALTMALTAALLAGCASGPSPDAPPQARIDAETLRAWSPRWLLAPITQADERLATRRAAEAQLALAERDETDLRGSLHALHNVVFLGLDAQRGRALLQRSLSAHPLSTLPAPLQRELLTQAHQLDPALAAPFVRRQWAALATPREFAIGAWIVLRGAPDARAEVQAQLAARADAGRDPRLIQLARAFAPSQPAPPLADLLAALPGRALVVSLQRTDRRHPGRLLLRAPDGRFLREADGTLFSRLHLAMALNQLPGTITNGQTPQGLFSIVGAGQALTNPWIGPTPYLHSKLPFEAAPAEFEHRAPQPGESWTLARYRALLPASWKGYAPFEDAFLAGQAGRDELLLHGTTIDARAYAGSPWHPSTPSAGCLVALEHWSWRDGRLLRSDQLTIAQAFSQLSGDGRGFLIVVELPDLPAAVSAEEVASLVAQAEGTALAARRP